MKQIFILLASTVVSASIVLQGEEAIQQQVEVVAGEIPATPLNGVYQQAAIHVETGVTLGLLQMDSVTVESSKPTAAN